jgi:ATP-dependent Clp protease adaptor protein ClpS
MLVCMNEITKEIQKSAPEIDVLTEDTVNTGLESRVVLYNDDWHTFDEVIAQLIKAVHCSFDKARAHAFEVHIKGKSIVFNGQLKDCLRVSGILEEIALTTEIVT